MSGCSAYQRTVAGEPVGERHCRRVTERPQGRVVQRVPPVVTLAVLDVVDRLPAGAAGVKQAAGQFLVDQLDVAADVIDAAGLAALARRAGCPGSDHRRAPTP